MKRETVKLIKALAYRRRLAAGIPEIEDRIRALVPPGDRVITRKYMASVGRSGKIYIYENTEQGYKLIPLFQGGVS